MEVDAFQLADAIEADFLKLATSYDLDLARTVRVNNWFSWKWYKFSGKVLGALGTWNTRATVPPFVPARVIAETPWARSGDNWEQDHDRNVIHASVSGETASRRYLDREAPSEGFCWIGIPSEPADRLAVMIYLPMSEDGYWCFYIDFSRDPRWRVKLTKSISPSEWRMSFPRVTASAESESSV